MDHRKKTLFPWILKVLLMALALFLGVEEASSSSTNDRFCFSDCDTCPLICSPPPPTPLITISASYPPPSSSSSPSAPHSYVPFSPPPPPSKSHSPPSLLPSPPPLKPDYNTPVSSGSTTQPQPTDPNVSELEEGVCVGRRLEVGMNKLRSIEFE
ncbi:hypothetical protein PIB30_038572 [Stylosanthes scabra]|uniref:Uncharacterized protein n=1 Tax=Stylosanthes scabra TaxID=79078 RepID=A0ABU6ZC47_9FABA|nr:hypothetical protein [Stylosanthes scabra]